MSEHMKPVTRRALRQGLGVHTATQALTFYASRGPAPRLLLSNTTHPQRGPLL